MIYIYKEYTDKVKIHWIGKNPQVTKMFLLNQFNKKNSWVGTSEAIRTLNRINKLNFKKDFHTSSYLLNNNNNNKLKINKKTNEWLAGLIDGDGCFILSKQGYGSLEITMGIRDERALNYIKNIYGGSLKLRSNANAILAPPPLCWGGE